MPIIDGYTATISGHTVTFGQPIIMWSILRDHLAQAAGLPQENWAKYLPKENKPNAELGDHIHPGYDLTEPKDFVLVPYAAVHERGYQAAKDMTV